MKNWELEEKPFKDAKVRDIRTKKELSWPYLKSPEQFAFEDKFLPNIFDSDTGEYNPKREDGKVVKTTPENVPKYTVNSIQRLKRKDGCEYLLSMGTIHAHNALGNEITWPVFHPEKYLLTKMVYEQEWDDTKKMVVNNCKGPGFTEVVYTLPFNENNLKQLFDSRVNDDISFIVKDEVTDRTIGVHPEPNIQATYKRFLLPFKDLF